MIHYMIFNELLLRNILFRIYKNLLSIENYLFRRYLDAMEPLFLNFHRYSN